MNKLHYKGDCRDFVPNRVVGPDNWGAWYLPVSAHYFDGVTTMFFKPVPPDKLPPECLTMSRQVVAQQQRKVGQWPHASAPSLSERSLNSLPASPTSPLSGGQKRTGASAGTGLTRSQRRLLKRFRQPGSR